MTRKFTLIMLISLLLTAPAFAQSDSSVSEEEEHQVPEGIRNNEFYLESLRLTNLAHETFEFGDYDASAGFAQEAIRFAQLSDEFVSAQLLAEAKRLLDWADANDIANQNPSDYNESKDYYEASQEFHYNDEWNEAIPLSIKAIGILAAFETETVDDGVAPLPSQYTVRPWNVAKDCLWNIASYSWVYGDPQMWRHLYEANKSIMPDPDNPSLIEPGMVLEIPSIRGEFRQGMWSADRTYGTP